MKRQYYLTKKRKMLYMLLPRRFLDTTLLNKNDEAQIGSQIHLVGVGDNKTIQDKTESPSHIFKHQTKKEIR